MKMLCKIGNFLAVSSLIFSVAALAGGEDTNVNPDISVPVNMDQGFYLNGNIGGGSVDLDPSLATVTVDRSGFVWSVNAGYQFNSYLAAEAGYIHLPTQRIKSSGVISGTSVAVDEQLDLYGFLLAVKGMYPFAERFDVFGKAGIAIERASGTNSVTISGTKISLVGIPENQTQVAGYFALGLEYAVTPCWKVNAQGVVVTSSGGFPTTWAGLAGVSYLFA